jgi:hypothetical protein
VFFNGSLFRGNTVRKTDSNKFGGFESTLPPLVREDVDLLPHESISSRIYDYQKPVSFYNNLSEDFVCIQVIRFVSKIFFETLINQPSVQGLLLDFSHGFSEYNSTHKMITSLTEDALLKSSLIRPCRVYTSPE